MKARLFRSPVAPVSNARPFILCFILFFFTSLRIMAQRDNPMFFKEIQLEPKKKYTLQTITREIQRQTGISFSYNAARISPATLIRMKEGRITVAQLLSSIRKKTGIGYKVVSKAHIIYTEAGNSKKKSKVKGSKKKALEQHIPVLPESEIMVLRPLGADSVTGQQIVIIGDSSVATYYFSGGASSAGGYAGHNDTRYPILMDVTEEDDEFDHLYTDESGLSRNTSKGSSGNREALTYIKNNTLIASGISADETYFFAPTVRIGFDFLYGTVSYNFGSHAHWRFGAGSSLPINENWKLHLNINSGSTLSEAYNIQLFDTIPSQDSIENPTIIEHNTPLLVQSRLTRFTLSAEYNLGRGFILSGGLTLNRLKTEYSSKGDPVTLSSILPIGYDADEKYQTLKPPYLLGNTYNGNSSSNVKTWIGLQLTLIYRLQFFD